MIGVLLGLFQLSAALNEITISSAQQSSSMDATSLAGKAIDDDTSTSSYTNANEKSWINLKLNGPTQLNKVVIRGQAAAECVFVVNVTVEDGSTRFCEEYTGGGVSLYNKNVKCGGKTATEINISEREACPQAMQMYEIKAFGPCEKGQFSAPKEIGTYTLVGQPWENMTQLICTECAPGTFSNTKSGKRNCDVCDAGNWSNAGAETCTPCDAGNWSNAGAVSCMKCDAGKWSNAGAAECTDCTGGKTSEAGSTSVQSCYYGKKLDFKRY